MGWEITQDGIDKILEYVNETFNSVSLLFFLLVAIIVGIWIFGEILEIIRSKK